jgi:hypothetical protein
VVVGGVVTALSALGAALAVVVVLRRRRASI